MKPDRANTGLLARVEPVRPLTPSEDREGRTEPRADRVVPILRLDQSRRRRLQTGRRTIRPLRQATGVPLPGHRRRRAGLLHTRLEAENRGAELTVMDDGATPDPGPTSARAEVGTEISRVIKEDSGEADGSRELGMPGWQGAGTPQERMATPSRTRRTCPTGWKRYWPVCFSQQ